MPTLAAFRNFTTFSVYLSSASKSRIAILLGLVLARRTPYPEPSSLLHGASSATPLLSFEKAAVKAWPLGVW